MKPKPVSRLEWSEPKGVVIVRAQRTVARHVRPAILGSILVTIFMGMISYLAYYPGGAILLPLASVIGMCWIIPAWAFVESKGFLCEHQKFALDEQGVSMSRSLPASPIMNWEALAGWTSESVGEGVLEIMLFVDKRPNGKWLIDLQEGTTRLELSAESEQFESAIKPFISERVGEEGSYSPPQLTSRQRWAFVLATGCWPGLMLGSGALLAKSVLGVFVPCLLLAASAICGPGSCVRRRILCYSEDSPILRRAALLSNLAAVGWCCILIMMLAWTLAMTLIE
ncbi:MAG: hypothetical protein ACI8W8_001942 [Rhodothermales bacterium]